jgi:hypothetical protein
MKGILLSCFALILLAAPPASAEPKVRELSIVIAAGQVLVSFELEGGFTRDLGQRMESGLPTGFVYELALARDRQWFDASVDSARLEVVAMFNAVTREYLVNTKLQGKLIDSQTLRDPGDLERAMTRFTALPVFTLPPTAQRARYLVRVRVELGTGQVLGFVPYLKNTEWVESNKARLN